MDETRATYVITEIQTLLNTLGKTRKHNTKCYRHDIFEKWDLMDLHSYPQYTWQWNFTVEEYQTIKDLLYKHADVLPHIIKEAKDNGKKEYKICCKFLQMYVSEWYKREYNGSDGQEKAFESISLYNIEAQDILEGLFEHPDDMVYRSSIDGTGNEKGQREWLETIYVDGGLPLRYFDNKNSSNLRKAIVNVIANDEMELSEKVLLFGNIYGSKGPIYQSYGAELLHPNDDKSIFDFIQEWVIDSNLRIPEFERLKDQLIEGGNECRKELLKEKIEVRFKVYKTAIDFQLIPQLYLKKNTDKFNYAISEERLNEWKVQPQHNRFVFKIKDESGRIWEKQFCKCMAGYYITFPKKDRFDLKIDKNHYQQCLRKWEVLIDGKLITDRALTNNLQDNGYVKMYSKDGFSWYSQWSSDSNYSAVLFDKSRVKEDFETVDKIASLGWVQIEDSMKLTIDDKETVFYNKTGDLFVEPESRPWDDNFKGRNTDGKPLYLIFCGEKPSFKVLLSKGGNDEDIRNKVSYEYRYGNRGVFSTLEKIDQCGYVEVRIKYDKEDKNRTIRCFALPQDATIRNYNDGNSRRTDFINFYGLTISCDGVKLDVDKSKGVWKKHWGTFTENDYNHPQATYLVTDGKVGFELMFYKPIDATVVKKRLNEEMVDFGRKNKGLRLPIIAIDKMVIRQLPYDDRDRCIKFEEKVPFRVQAFKALMNHQYNDNATLVQTYLKFQTFTHTLSLGGEIGNLCLKDLRFVFVPTNEPRNYQDVRLIPGNTLQFVIPSQEEGIIVQCIGKYEIPKVLLKPIYVPAYGQHQDLKEWEKQDKRRMRISRYQDNYESDTPKYDDALAYFDVAAETGMYFGAFDALLGLVCHPVNPQKSNEMILSTAAPKHLALFYKHYVEQGIRVNYDALWRMADEFLFDWYLIPSIYWDDLFDEKTYIYELLNHKPHKFEKLLQNRFQLRNKTIEDKNINIVLRTITTTWGNKNNTYEKACFWKTDLPARISVLKTLIEADADSFSKYITILTINN